MTDEELKNKCKERAKIFQQAMESCKSLSPMDCIEWFTDRIAELEKENAELKLKLEALDGHTPWKDIKDKSEVIGKLTKAKELLAKWVELFKPKLEGYPITPIQEQTEQFLNGESCPDCFCEDCTKDCGIKKLGLVEVENDRNR